MCRHPRLPRAARRTVPAALTVVLGATLGVVGAPASNAQPFVGDTATQVVTNWPPVQAGPPIQRVAKAPAQRLRHAAQQAARNDGPPAPTPAPAPLKVRLVQANIFTGLGPAQFAADRNEVVAHAPDFITLNEVDHRSAAEITPPGYEMYRGTADRWALETPVLWRTADWTRFDSGTEVMHDRRGVKWGKRTANWVSLRNTDGTVVSVITAHTSPTVRTTHGLLDVYMQRLNALADRLAARGTVLVGGDLNVAYRASDYPARIMAAGGLAATWDRFGKPAGGTGDHNGAVIDYVLYHQSSALTPDDDGTFELNSDHDGVFADFTIAPPTTS